MNDVDAPDYQVYAIRFSHDGHRKLSENFMAPLVEPIDLHDTPMPIDFYVWVLVGGGRSIVVDTGFDAVEAGKRGRTIALPVRDGLAAIGVDPETVEHVIVTHLHWDHAGNHDLFPQATYHVQDAEMAFCTGRCMCDAFVRRPFSADDVTSMVRRIYSGRVRFHDGVGAIVPGVTVHLTGGHSEGLQVVRVKTERGWLALASDASHYYANLEQDRPFPVLASVTGVFSGYRTLRAIASSPQQIIPGHDPLVLTRFPRVHAELTDIVRLDVAPVAWT